MPRRIVGQSSREIQDDSNHYRGPRSRSGARLRSRQSVNAPEARGVGPYYTKDE